MKIGISTNALHCNTGYGIQARYLATRLRDAGHEVVVYAFYGVRGGILNIGGFPHYPAGRLEYNADVIERHVQHSGAEVLLTICDLAHQDPETIRRIRAAGVQVLHWVPLDCAPMSVIDAMILKVGGGQPVAMSRFGEASMQDRGFAPLYAPHAVNTGIFAPAPAAVREQLREQEGLTGLFTVAFNAMNKDILRKGFFEGYEAFAAFHQAHPDSRLLLHSELDGSFDHDTKIRQLGLEKAVTATDDYPIKCGMLDEDYMAAWCNLADVGLMPSWGEGFGVPAIEYQACGLPVIATDCSALTELVQPGIGWRIPGELKYQPLHKAAWRAPVIHDLTSALNRAYTGWKRGGSAWAQRQDKARQFAQAYDADRVFDEYWRPVLARLEAGEFKA